MKIFFGSLILLAVFFINANPTEAFVAESNRAVALNKNIAILSISFSARFIDKETYFPILARHQGTLTEKPLSVRYEIRRGDRVITPEFTIGFIESSADIVNGVFKIPAGDDEIMNLEAIVKLPEGESVDDIYAVITNIPVVGVGSDNSVKMYYLHGGVFGTATSSTPAEYRKKPNKF